MRGMVEGDGGTSQRKAGRGVALSKEMGTGASIPNSS